MATKTETKPTAAKTAAPKAAGPAFEIKKGLPLPVVTRPGRGSENPYIATMKMLKLGKKPEDLECFDVPVTVGDHIQLEERPKAIKEEARKINSRVSGAARRVTKSDPSYRFAARTVNDGTNTVIRVFRVAAE